MGLSSSTLKRNLANENTSIRILRQKVIIELAHKLLLNSNSPISDISARLGFSEHSAFCRFFIRNHGESPNQFRLNNKQ